MLNVLFFYFNKFGELLCISNLQEEQGENGAHPSRASK